MTGQFWLTHEQVERLRPHFPRLGASHMRYTRCADLFLSAIALAAIIF